MLSNLFVFHKGRSNIWILLLLMLYFGGCSVIETIPTVSQSQQAWQQRLQRLQNQSDWNIQASLAGISGEEQFKARFLWQQRQHSYEIKLFDPLGRTVAKITGSDQQVEVRTSKGEYYRDTDAQSLIMELFGINLPVDGLRYWALGIPESDLGTIEVDERGLASRITESGWKIDYLDYAVFSMEPMPRKFALEYESTQLNVSVGSWELL